MKLKSLILLTSIGMMSIGITSCTTDDGSIFGPDDIMNHYPGKIVLDFENTAKYVATTSAGENYYDSYKNKSEQVTEVISKVDTVVFHMPVGESSGKHNAWSGATMISQYNYMSNPLGKEGEWWYSYKNQASVYNTSSEDGTNMYAGANGSKLFGVLNGITFGKLEGGKRPTPEILLKNEKGNPIELKAESIAICPTSYLYGVIMNGNGFSTPIDKEGWYSVYVFGYNAKGEPTNDGNPVKIKVISQSPKYGPTVDIATTWKSYDISALGKVAKLAFYCAGSDSGQYGLNTPAYIAIDDVVFGD